MVNTSPGKTKDGAKVVDTQPRPSPLLGWLWQVSLAGLVNFRLAFGNYRNGYLPRKGLVDFTKGARQKYLCKFIP
jgi:hypothetical protein